MRRHDDGDAALLHEARDEQVLALVEGLVKERGITVVMATHSAEAAAHASRILRLRDGRLEP